MPAQMKRDDYKAVKRMDRIQMTEYVTTVYKRGYDAGFKAATPKKAESAGGADAQPAVEEPSPLAPAT